MTSMREATMTETSTITETARPRVKDSLACAGALGLVSIAWFGWALGGQLLQPVLVGLMAVGLVIGLTSFFCRRRAPGVGTHEVNRRANRTWNLAVLFEFVLILGGSFVLGRLGHIEYLSAWTLFVVGVHFLPLAKLYRMPSLNILAGLCTVIAAAALVAGREGWAHPVFVAAGPGGLALLAVAGYELVRSRHLVAGASR